MKQPLQIASGAEADLKHGAAWYEDQSPRLGRVFVEAIETTFRRLLAFPSAGSPVPGLPDDVGARRASVRKFPYQVVYLEGDETIHVLAVAHEHRRPNYWVGRERFEEILSKIPHVEPDPEDRL